MTRDTFLDDFRSELPGEAVLEDGPILRITAGQREHSFCLLANGEIGHISGDAGRLDDTWEAHENLETIEEAKSRL